MIVRFLRTQITYLRTWLAYHHTQISFYRTRISHYRTQILHWRTHVFFNHFDLKNKHVSGSITFGCGSVRFVCVSRVEYNDTSWRIFLSAFFFRKHILKLFKLKKIRLLGYLKINETLSNKNFGNFCMHSLFKFHCSITQAHCFFCSHFHNLNGEERERKDKLRASKLFRASILFSCFVVHVLFKFLQMSKLVTLSGLEVNHFSNRLVVFIEKYFSNAYQNFT